MAHGKTYDVLAIGEVLVDLIAEQEGGLLADIQRFVRYPGGTVANVALNVARLGGTAALVGSVGSDAFGQFLYQQLEIAGIDVAHLQTRQRMPSTLITVTRHHETPDFSVYRGADRVINCEDIPLSLLQSSSFVHTSAFALSLEPARSGIIESIERASAAGCLVSFDPNYHPRIWGEDVDPMPVLEKVYSHVFLTKPSLDDSVRLFGPGLSPEAYAARFLALGAQQVILTMGGAGVLLANAQGMTRFPTRPVEVVDVTGAGDCFSAALMLATLDGYAMPEAIEVAQAVVAIKLRQVGPLSQQIERTALYAQLGLPSLPRSGSGREEE